MSETTAQSVIRHTDESRIALRLVQQQVLQHIEQTAADERRQRESNKLRLAQMDAMQKQ